MYTSPEYVFGSVIARTVCTGCRGRTENPVGTDDGRVSSAWDDIGDIKAGTEVAIHCRRVSASFALSCICNEWD